MRDRAWWSVHLHLFLVIAWALTIIPTLVWWRESILWVAFMSLYANVVGHWSAYEARKAKESADANSGS